MPDPTSARPRLLAARVKTGYARSIVLPFSGTESPRRPGDDERAALAQRGFALVRGWLAAEPLARLHGELRAGRRVALVELNGSQAALEAWFGGTVRATECELGAVQGSARALDAWRQEYGCVLRDGELRPLRHAAWIGLAGFLEVEVALGSHGMGRMAHRHRAGASAMPPERARTALAEFEPLSFELAPGDALLFHANLLHRVLSAPGDGDGAYAVTRFDVER